MDLIAVLNFIYAKNQWKIFISLYIGEVKPFSVP
jgi:hypothetical protein